MIEVKAKLGQSERQPRGQTEENQSVAVDVRRLQDVPGFAQRGGGIPEMQQDAQIGNPFGEGCCAQQNVFAGGSLAEEFRFHIDDITDG